MMKLGLLAQDEEAADDGIARAWEQIDAITNGFFAILPNLLIAVVVFIVIMFFARLLQSFIQKWTADRQSANIGLVIGRLAKWVLLFLGLMIGVSIVTPSVGASEIFGMLGIGSVAIGFAFKDILQNFLAGILILLREPFRVGDAIVVAGHTGIVETIETRSTVLKTYDGQRVFIPNGEVFTNPVEVISAFPHRRRNCKVGIGYTEDVSQAVSEVLSAIQTVPEVLDDPAPFVQVAGFAESSVELQAFWWAKNEDYGSAGSAVLTAIKNKLDEANIEIPFPTRVVVQPKASS